MLISTDSGNLDYLEYPASGFAKTLASQGSGTHHVRIVVDFLANHVTVYEGGTMKYDASLETSLANTESASAVIGLYDSDAARAVTIDNVTLDWTD